MKWETVSPKPQPKTLPHSRIKVGEVRLSVTEGLGGEDNNRQWQYFDLSFGEFSNESHDACCVTWPKEAIAKARKLLDELEKQCEGEPCTEP